MSRSKETTMSTFSFWWAPEGRKLATYKAKDVKEAKSFFRKDFPQHAKFMGEVGINWPDA
jgi:hypothetical protein